MKKLIVILLFTFHFSLFTATQAQKPYIPTMEDYCKQFSESKDWTVSCVKGLQVDTHLVVDALLFQVENNEQWERLLVQFHIRPSQLWSPYDQRLHMGWNRTWRRDLQKEAFRKTPGEHACLLFLSPMTATALLLFPYSSADEERLVDFFLAKYANQGPVLLRRDHASTWLYPILQWAEYMQYMMQYDTYDPSL